MSKVKSLNGQELKFIQFLSKQAAEFWAKFPTFLRMKLVQDPERTFANFINIYHQEIVSY